MNNKSNGVIRRFFFLLPIITLFIIGCFNITSGNTPREWTILIYMAADNGLNDRAVEDILQMKEAEFSEECNIIVQVDYSQSNSYEGAKRYQIFPDDATQLAALGEIDSGNYSSLANFINWGYSNFPSNRRALFLWSHGNGWYNHNPQTVFMPDQQAHSYFDIPNGDLHDAFNLSNYHLDLLVFDACNMLTVEVLSEVAEFADYIIGTEDTVPQYGFPYDEIFSTWENQTLSSAISLEIVNKYVNSYLPFGSQNQDGSYLGSISISAVDCSEFIELEEQLALFFQMHPFLVSQTEFAEARENCQFEFNDLHVDIDIKEFFQNLSSLYENEATTQILQQINTTFIAQEYLRFPDDFSDTIGTAVIWFPDNNHQHVYNNLLHLYRKLLFDKNTNWSIFLADYY